MKTTIPYIEKPDLCVFIGRFQPLHAGHMRVISEGLRRGKFMVVLVGSAHEPRSYRNPFLVAERIKLIRETFNNDPRLVLLPLEDSNYNLNDWIERAHQAVDQAWEMIKTQNPAAPSLPSIALIGHAKDASSFYLNLFPRWASIDVAQEHVLCATTIRKKIFGSLDLIRAELDTRFFSEASSATSAQELTRIIKEVSGMTTPEYLARYQDLARAGASAFLAEQRAASVPDLPPPVLAFLEEFIHTQDYENITREYAFVAKYQYAWRFAPHPPIFTTSDAVVIQSGHVLMVKRKGFPGKGLWALPGGFVEADETIENSCLRELDEETSLRVPPAVLRGHIRAREVFDAPFRSSRGRTITHAFLIHLDPGPLPKIKTGGQPGDEETYKIDWVPLAKLRRDQCFEDHYAIIQTMHAKLGKGNAS